jgi:hypothetical protein
MWCSNILKLILLGGVFIFFKIIFSFWFSAAQVVASPPAVFAPVLLKRGEKKLSCREVQQSIPSFHSDGLESHIQNYPWAEVRYANYPLSTLVPRFQLSDSTFEFEFAKSGHGPVDSATKKYLHHDEYEVRHCLQSNVRTQRFVPEFQAIMVINMMIPAWGCLHTRSFSNLHAFFRCFSDDVDTIQLDSVWTRYCIPFRYQFSNCEDGRFSSVSTVRVFVDHHTCSGNWKVKGNVFRFNSHFNPAQIIQTPAVQTDEQSPSFPGDVHFQQMAEELSASRLFAMPKKTSSIIEVVNEGEMFVRRE